MIFSIAMGAEYFSYVKSIATFAPIFYGYIISILASVKSNLSKKRTVHSQNSFNAILIENADDCYGYWTILERSLWN